MIEAMEDLATVLRRERDLLDRLRFRFIQARLLLAASETRYLCWAAAEIEHARMRAREADLLRAAAVHRTITPLADAPPTLRMLAAEANEPWSGILRDHHEGLCTLVAEIEVVGHRNAALAREGIHRLASAAAPSFVDRWLAGPDSNGGSAVAVAAIDVDAPSGATADELTGPAEESAYQEMISTASRLEMPALLAFLR